MNKKRLFGFILVFIGLAFFLLKVVLTGAVIGTSRTEIIGLTGALIIIIGIVIILASGPSGLEQRIIRTDRFEKSVRKYDPALIESAIKKIGSGAGKEEYLKHMQVRSIRVSHGGRILFNRTQKGIELIEYLPPSEHY